MPPLHSVVHLPALALLGAAIIACFYGGRAVRVARLPSLIGYLLVGVLLGPSILGFFDETTLEHISFITDIALGFVAFSIGAEQNAAAPPATMVPG